MTHTDNYIYFVEKETDMLKSFSVTNFKAFEKPIKVDFDTTGNYEFNKEALKDGIVKTDVMYGKNAGGKSSLGFAIFDIVATLTDNFIDVKNYINYKISSIIIYIKI